MSALFQCVSLDILQLSTSTEEGWKHILVVLDELSKFIFLIGLRNKTMAHVAEQAWNEAFSIIGPPSAILTDNEKAFTESAIQTFCQQFNVEKILTIPRMPTMNPNNERSHAVIIQAIRTLLDGHAVLRKNHIRTIMYAMNTFPPTQTLYSAYQLVFGQLPNDPYLVQLHDSILPPPGNNK